MFLLHFSKPQRLTNADFRKLLMTPRAPTGVKEQAPIPTGTTQTRPETISKVIEAKEDVKASERKKKKRYCTAFFKILHSTKNVKIIMLLLKGCLTTASVFCIHNF